MIGERGAEVKTQNRCRAWKPIDIGVRRSAARKWVDLTHSNVLTE